MKTYELNGEKVFLRKSTYAKSGSLFVGAICASDGFPAMDITTNCPDAVFPAHGSMQYVFYGTRYGINIVEFLEENGIAECLDVYAQSGFNTYVLMDFAKSIEEMDEA